MAAVTLESSVAIDLAAVAKSLDLPAPRVETVVKLLDEGNTVPFITRYRKDQTGGLDEEPIRQIHNLVTKQRLLAERKQTILRSIDSQGKLTPELSAAIHAAKTTRQLEDLYLPYKPKKQTLATTARARGLEPLALEILNADPLAADLDARLKDFVNSDKQVPTSADALLGAGHILAEIFSERVDFRSRVRSILEKSGRLITSAVEPEAKTPSPDSSSSLPLPPSESSDEGGNKEDADRPLFAGLSDDAPPEEPGPDVDIETAIESNQMKAEGDPSGEAVPIPVNEIPGQETTPAETESQPDAKTESAELPAATSEQKPPKSKEKKKKKPLTKAERRAADLQRAFRDYFDYSEALSRVPPHRVLAINRGEKIKVLRVKIEGDAAPMERFIDETLVPSNHPHADFLRGCGRDALQRLVLPGLEREFRRELTDAAELHAVEVFAKNLRNLLLQPPVRERRLLALDPGFKSGCKYVALDEFGNLLEHGVVFIIGNAERRAQSKAKLLEVVKNHQLSVIVVGNGTACRETETFVADLLTTDLAGAGVSYVIVSECGASVYSASPLGREEFPNCDATVRGAVSIGRRLQDPLSELVKIDPASLGVGLYQHDVKAKHLRDSLDGVVESCVNYVGVDLNTASPSLLRYVSGLNQLTAQRIYDHRKEHGPFKTRAQLNEVSGIGEQTFVQAAGFLKITGGDDPLDTTWIHPESYAAAESLLEQLGAEKADLLDKEKVSKLSEKARGVDMQRTALKLKVGTLTLHDIIAQLTRPGRDPREGLPQPIFKQGILKLDDLAPGMELRGTVLNVVDFGAFVDIGLKDSGLVHVSRLANRFVKDPHEVVSVGDIVKVWVMEVDKQRRRVSLTMIAPGTKRPEPERPQREPTAEGRGERRPEGRGGPGRSGQSRGGKPDGGRRFDRRSPKHADAAESQPPPVEPPKPKPPTKPVKLTKAKLQGRAYLQSFGELTAFLAPPAPAASPSPSVSPSPSHPLSPSEPESGREGEGENGSAPGAGASPPKA